MRLQRAEGPPYTSLARGPRWAARERRRAVSPTCRSLHQPEQPRCPIHAAPSYGWDGRRRLAVLFFTAVTLLTTPTPGQQIQLNQPTLANQSAPNKTHILQLTDALDVSANKPQLTELRFRVDPGFHINSHHPKDELLIPTALHLDETSAIKVLDQQYPAGAPFHLPIGAGETLDVYQGEFRIILRLIAPPGANTLTGTLRYQACDNAACFPPRSLPVKVLITAK